MSKRKLEEEDSLSTTSSDSADSLGNVEEYQSAKRNRRVRFSDRTVFHFPRTQGYTCVPSNGGTTLGMKHKHSFVERTLISEEDQSESDTEDSYDSVDSDDEHSFMPISQKDRKDILKAAGVKKINKQEAIDCMQISREGCQNTHGRHEYDPITVRRHFIETVWKLRGEKYLWREKKPDPQHDSNDLQASRQVMGLTSVS
ncbi:Cysteine/serine-rich nuclear protein 3 [Stylophora pistillata]|uniref:Cysteine/serine-rich nuclear protein 3 n=1 Tax=Stylophora pistillata TaxID=50429 RepID=A0A2B4RKC2_STYPI|nr:Cysteine/serine-rich nuclear protein 3 [Stylophora pistillata]